MRKTLERPLTHFDHLLRQAILDLESRREPKAVERLREALGLKPFSADAWFWLGRAYEELGRTKDAAYCFNLCSHCDLKHQLGRQGLKRLGWYESAEEAP